MAKQNFTAARVDGFTCEPGKQQSIFWDAKTPGFGIRVTATGAKAYIFESRLFGKTIRVTIGDTRAWELGKARTEASHLKTLIDAGKDPREVKAEQQAAHEERHAAKVRESVTVASAWSDYVDSLRTKLSPKTKKPRSAAYINDHLKLAARGGEPTKRGGKQTERGPLYPLMELKLSCLTAKTVGAWLESEVPIRPTSAAYAFRMLKAFARWCEGVDLHRILTHDLHRKLTHPKSC